MSFDLTEDGVAALSKRLSEAVADPSKDIPGAVVCVVNKAGELIFSHADGQLGANSSESMTESQLGRDGFP